MLKDRFVPVAIDQAYQRRQKDTEGEFYRKIAGQGPRNNFQSTTQGFYVASPSGKLLLFNNNRDPEKVARLMLKALREYQPKTVGIIKSTSTDKRYNPELPEGGLVVRVRAKVLGGYEPTTNRWRKIFQSATGRDNLWISRSEHQSLAKGEVPTSLQQRLARYHLVDNTRGEPPMWERSEIRQLDMKVNHGELTGSFHLKSRRGDREFKGEIRGNIEVSKGKVTRIDLVALGQFEGEGPYTRNAPKGKFPLAVSFELADGSDTADKIPPQGSRGWLPGYLKESN